LLVLAYGLLCPWIGFGENGALMLAQWSAAKHSLPMFSYFSAIFDLVVIWKCNHCHRVPSIHSYALAEVCLHWINSEFSVWLKKIMKIVWASHAVKNQMKSFWSRDMALYHPLLLYSKRQLRNHEGNAISEWFDSTYIHALCLPT
jgi:hypothetical protein